LGIEGCELTYSFTGTRERNCAELRY